MNVIGENARACVPGDVVRITGTFAPLMRTGFRQFTGGLTTEVFVEAHHIENINMVCISLKFLYIILIPVLNNHSGFKDPTLESWAFLEVSGKLANLHIKERSKKG